MIRFRVKIHYSYSYFRGISTVAVHLLPKQETRVRFSYPAPSFAKATDGKLIYLGLPYEALA